MHGFQVGGTIPPGMLSCIFSVMVLGEGQWKAERHYHQADQYDNLNNISDDEVA